MEGFEQIPIDIFPPSVPRSSFQNAIPMRAPLYMPLPPGANGDFEISRLTGQKRALLIGINYTDTPKELGGSIDDAYRMRQLLVDHYSFPHDAVVVLTDDNPQAMPTKARILDGLRWLVADAQPNDSLVLQYSGHSMRLGYSSNFGLEEALCPIDAYLAGYVSGQDLHRIVVKNLPAGCRLTVLMDCCNSRPAMELAYEYDEYASLDRVFFLKARRKFYASRVCSVQSCWAAPFRAGSPVYARPRDPTASLTFSSAFKDVLLFSG